MEKVKKLAVKAIHHFRHDTLYRNSIYIMASTTILAFFGFFFWMIVARIYNPHLVGIATTLISVMTLLAGISIFGLNISLIRFLPKYADKNSMINSTLVITGISSIFVAILFLLGINFFSPKLSFITTNSLYIIIFIMSIIVSCWNLILEGIFIAYRAAENIVVKNTIISILKLALPFIFISLAAYGIFTSVIVSISVAVIVSLTLLFFRYDFKPKLTVNTKSLSHMARFSSINYFAGLLYQAPTLLLPLIIINYLSTNFAAYYYIDAMILNFLTIIPIAASQSLLAEGSHDSKNLDVHFKKTIGLIAILLIPPVIIFTLFGNFILNFFGQGYATNAFVLLQLMSLSCIFIAIQLLGAAALRIKHKNAVLLIFNGIGCLITLSLCLGLVRLGLNAVGIGWLIGQIILGVLFAILLAREIFSPKLKI